MSSISSNKSIPSKEGGSVLLISARDLNMPIDHEPIFSVHRHDFQIVGTKKMCPDIPKGLLNSGAINFNSPQLGS